MKPVLSFALTLAALTSFSTFAYAQSMTGKVQVIGRSFPMAVGLDVFYNGSCSEEDAHFQGAVDANGNFAMPAVTGFENFNSDIVTLVNTATHETMGVLSRGAGGGGFANELNRTFLVHETRMGSPVQVHVTWPQGTLKEYVKQLMAANPELAKAAKDAKAHWQITGKIGLSRDFGLIHEQEAIYKEEVPGCNFVRTCWADQQNGAAKDITMSFNQSPKRLYVVEEDFQRGFVQTLVAQDLTGFTQRDDGKILLVLDGNDRSYGTVADITLATVSSQNVAPGQAVEIRLANPNQITEYTIYNSGGGVISSKK